MLIETPWGRKFLGGFHFLIFIISEFLPVIFFQIFLEKDSLVKKDARDIERESFSVNIRTLWFSER